MDEGTVLCEVLYVVLSLMSGYYAQGASLRVLQSHTRNDLGNMPWCLPSSTHLKGGMLQGSAARSRALLQLFGEAGGEKHLHCASSVIQS